MLRHSLFALVVWVAWVVQPALACAPAFPEGASVAVTGEQALIVWDADAGVEHFIRRGNFETDADDFGFLVPTPTQPLLTEVDDQVFNRLQAHRQPPVEYTSSFIPVTCCMAPFMLVFGAEPEAILVSATAAPAVEVLSETRVAGLDATVLRASDAEALGAWLGDHGYENRPALVEWLAPYVEADFVVTAFRFEKPAAGEESLSIQSQFVRMTFETDRPFYPYREPSDQPEHEGRALWVHVVAAARAEGLLEGLGPWDAETIFAAPIDDASALLGDSRSDLRGDLWLTTIIDRASLRPAADLFFDIAPGEELRPPPRVLEGAPSFLWLPIEPFVVLGAGIWWWRRRRARAAA